MQRKIFDCVLLLSFIAIATGCATAVNNETSYPYTFSAATFQNAKVNKIVIAHTNLGSPSRRYLDPYAGKIDAEVAKQLESSGFEIVDNQNFKSLWRGAARKHGAPYNDQTGRVNQRSLQAVLFDVMEGVRENGIADAILFTDLIERDVVFQGRNQRMARWDGVARPPSLRSGSGQLSADFNWNQSTSAVSLLLVMYDSEGAFLFKGAGGLDLTREIDTRSGNGRFVRKRTLFSNAKNLRQGVSIALHPLVPMEGYLEQ